MAIIVGAVAYPIVLLMPNYSNCWYYSLQRFVFEGFAGRVVPIESRRCKGIIAFMWITTGTLGIHIRKNA